MFVVDTNVLVYAADADALAHRQCGALMDEWRRQESAWYVTWSILYEFLRVSTHPRVLRQPWTADQAWQFVELLLALPGSVFWSRANAMRRWRIERSARRRTWLEIFCTICIQRY